MTSQAWHEEEIEILVDMWKKGFTTKQIAHELGRTQIQVKSFASRRRDEFGLEPRTQFSQRRDAQDKKSEYDKWLDKMWKGPVPFGHWTITKPWGKR